MNEEQWRQIYDLFGRALSVTGTSRSEFLRNACSDPMVVAEVEALIGMHERAAHSAGFDRSTVMVFLAGQVLADRFELTSVVGRGGMGTVYEARDRVMNERVALKVIRPELSNSAPGQGAFPLRNSAREAGLSPECLPDSRCRIPSRCEKR